MADLDDASGQAAREMLVQNSFDRLRKRAFGGGDVATRPGREDDSWWPQGPLLPGVRELIDDFVGCVSEKHGLNVFFLLGGAGNGKSFAARILGDRLGIQDDGGGLARRIYAIARDGVSIELLNDATIASKEEYGENQDVALSSDLERWFDDSLKRPTAVFCCVNRGIVIDELRALHERGASPGFSAAVLEWIASDEAYAGDFSMLGAKQVARSDGLRKEVGMESHGRQIRLVALPVDLASLLEVDDETGKTRGGTLFAEVLERCAKDLGPRPKFCPLRANINHWTTAGVVVWETIARFAEVASGRLDSYRDLWGLAALSILGSAPADDLSGASIVDYIDARLAAATSDGSPKARLSAWLELSQFRAHQALFRAPRPSGKGACAIYPPCTPVHTGLSLLDPAVWGSSDADLIEEAMNAVALGERPSEMLGKASGQILLSDFDLALETAVLEHASSQDCSEPDRRRLISWLGAYFVRLAGTSSGRVGNAEVVRSWLQCWELTKNGRAQLPFELGKALRSLIFPRPTGVTDEGDIIVPAFAPRMDPIHLEDNQGEPRLAIAINHAHLKLSIRRSKSRLLLECHRYDEKDPVAKVVLDFALLREALASRDGSAGATELSTQVAPRLERCRASSLAGAGEEVKRLVVISGAMPKEVGHAL